MGRGSQPAALSELGVMVRPHPPKLGTNLKFMQYLTDRYFGLAFYQEWIGSASRAGCYSFINFSVHQITPLPGTLHPHFNLSTTVLPRYACYITPRLASTAISLCLPVLYQYAHFTGRKFGRHQCVIQYVLWESHALSRCHLDNCFCD